MSAPPWTSEQTAGGILLAFNTVSKILKSSLVSVSIEKKMMTHIVDK